MRDMELQKAIGDNTCTWCFEEDDSVLRHDGSDTYWHEDCLGSAGDTIHQILDALSPKNNSRS